jgi:cbb3-type cytochrome oxidase maturation protein
MGIIFVLLPLSLLLAIIALAGYFWCVRSGQLDDLDTPAQRVILPEGEKGHE